jgi:hypothetical protein
MQSEAQGGAYLHILLCTTERVGTATCAATAALVGQRWKACLV